MRLQLPLYVDEASHRALRRCHGCGAYARPFEYDRIRNIVLCEPCAMRRKQRDNDGREGDPNEVNFLV